MCALYGRTGLHYCKIISQKIPKLNCFRAYSTTFYETDKKDGYGKSDERSYLQKMKEGMKELKGEIKLWQQEIKEKIEDDPQFVAHPGELKTVFDFKEPSALDQWILTTDSDHNEGFSTSTFTMSENKTAVFEGNLCLTVPKTGKTKLAGYCNIRTKRKRKSFKRNDFYAWFLYTHLVLKVRGDGRTYMINLSTEGTFDVMWSDVYHYVLHTRGGPYWQTTRIPFSRFFLGAKGRVQDKQYKIPLDRITNVGITAADRVEGPFRLEIQHIGLELDPDHTEEFAYEMYRLPKFTAGY